MRIKHRPEDLERLREKILMPPVKTTGIGVVEDLIVFDGVQGQRGDGSTMYLRAYCVPYRNGKNDVITANDIRVYVIIANNATEAGIAKILSLLANNKLVKVRAEVRGNRILTLLSVDECPECEDKIEANIEGIAKRTSDGTRVWIATDNETYLVSDLTIKGMTLCGEAVTGAAYAIFGHVIQGRRQGFYIIQGLHYQRLDEKTEVKAEEKRAEQKAEENPAEQAEGGAEETLSEEEIERIQEEHVKKALGELQ